MEGMRWAGVRRSRWTRSISRPKCQRCSADLVDPPAGCETIARIGDPDPPCFRWWASTPALD